MGLIGLNIVDLSTLNSLEHRLQKISRLREEKQSHTEPGGKGLINFVRTFWHVLEPNRPFVRGWVLEAIAEHLDAVTHRRINRLLINVSPGSMKSLLTNVFWPAWEWGPMKMPNIRGISFSYAAHLTERDNQKFRDLVRSKDFQDMYGDVFTITADGKIKIQNDKSGWQLASSVRGVSTGERADVLRADDLHNIKDSESDVVRQETVRWFRESMSNRLNDMDKSAIVVIMQRVHEDDVAGTIISDADGLGYTHLRIPMEYVDNGPWSTSTGIGWEDPRTKQGELCWPERFSPAVVQRIKETIGPFSFSSQYQQDPEPRGGAIIKRDWWRVWQPDEVGDICISCGSNDTKHLEGRGVLFECQACKHQFRGKPGKYPACSYILASLDTAYTEKERNDPSAMTVWGIFRHPETNEGGVILMDAWRKWLKLRGANVPRVEDESEAAWRARAEPEWGLTEWTWHTCRKFKVDSLIIENKASGISLQQELQLQHSKELWTTEMVNPVGDKEARVHAVQGIFAQGLVWAPNRHFADMTIDELAKFPFGKFRDLSDSTSQAMKTLRDRGLLKFEDERLYEAQEEMRYRPKQQALYPV